MDKNVLIIGSGRAAKNWAHYHRILDLPYFTWDRSQNIAELKNKISQCFHIYLLISDDSIEKFYWDNLSTFSGSVVHFSGSLDIGNVFSAHPLITFTSDLLEFEVLRNIPFVTTSSEKTHLLLPNMTNKVFKISPEDKAYYHSLCVISGNFTSLLWSKVNQDFQKIGLPKDIENLYRNQIFLNIQNNPANNLTGPFIRRDIQTILRNISSLENDPYKEVYLAFLKSYSNELFNLVNSRLVKNIHQQNQLEML